MQLAGKGQSSRKAVVVRLVLGDMDAVGKLLTKEKQDRCTPFFPSQSWCRKYKHGGEIQITVTAGLAG